MTSQVSTNTSLVTSKLFLFLNTLIFAVSVVFELPFIACALISCFIIGFITFIFFMYVHMANFFKSPVEKRRNSNTDNKHKEKEGGIFGRYILQGVSESVDEFLIYCRNALFLFFSALLGILQLCNGWVAVQFFPFLFQLTATVFVSAFIAQYATDGIWFCCVVMIKAVASTTQALVVGPFRIAFSVVKNILLFVMTTLFRIAKMIFFAIFGKLRKMFAFAATSVFPSLLQPQGEVEYGVDVDMYDEGYESGFAASRLRRYPKSSRGGVPWHKKLSN
jgi:hypothetical protein